MEDLENSSAAEGAPADVAPTTTEGSPSQTDPSGQPIEIDSPDRYRYQGRPLKEWEAGYMRQQDYTQKTQSLAQDRKFYDNLNADLDKVKANPELIEQFRQIYPAKFHAYLRYVQGNSPSRPQQPQQTQQQPNQTQQYAQLDPRIQSRIDKIEKDFRDKEVSAISAELDHKFKGLSEKYPFADEEAVVARAQALMSKMKELDPMNDNLRITDKQWDLLWKAQNERAEGLSDAQYKKKVQSQINANKKGSDVGRGGGLPGQAPRNPRTIKEATNQMLSDIESGAV